MTEANPQLFPCTNPNYGREDMHFSETTWWTKHADVPDEYKCVALYPVHPEGIVASEADFVMPDLGQVDLKRLPPEMREQAEYLNAKYGADNMISLVMGKWAEQYGYKPFDEAKAEVAPILVREAIINDLERDYNRGIEKWGELLAMVDEVEINNNAQQPTQVPTRSR